MPTLTFKKMWRHLRTVQTHRKWVRRYCRWAGIPWRGLVHDLSKYSPTEFFESARYYQGTSSPIDAAKKDQGYSKAWLHHKGHNTHHWAHWTDNYSDGTVTYMMPKKDFIEMVCDFLAAGRAYQKDKFTYAGEKAWWEKDKEKGNKAMNIKNKTMLDIIFSDLAYCERRAYIDVPTTEQLIKSGYFGTVWEANK